MCLENMILLNLRRTNHDITKLNLKVEITIVTLPTHSPVMTNIKGEMPMIKQTYKLKENIIYERNQKTYTIK